MGTITTIQYQYYTENSAVCVHLLQPVAVYYLNTLIKLI